MLVSSRSEWEDVKLWLCLLLLRYTISLSNPRFAADKMWCLISAFNLWFLKPRPRDRDVFRGMRPVLGVKSWHAHSLAEGRAGDGQKECVCSPPGHLVVSHLRLHPNMGTDLYH